MANRRQGQEKYSEIAEREKKKDPVIKSLLSPPGYNRLQLNCLMTLQSLGWED